MRNSTLLLLFATSASLQAQWSPRPSGTTHYLRDIFFPSSQIGFAVGDSGAIVRSQDGGENWTLIHDDPAVTLYGVHFPTPTTGFASGGSWGTGLVLKTEDGGDSWAPCLISPSQYFGAVFFLDTLLGYVGGPGHVLRTIDGGTSWDTIPGMATGAFFTSISFPSPQVGYFIGGTNVLDVLYRTTDAGLSSEPITNGYQVIKETCQFLNDSIGFMGGWYGSMLVKTTDGGQSWNSIFNADDGVWDLHFFDEQRGIYTGWGGGWTYIFTTSNGGTDWVYQYADTVHLLEALHMVDENTGFAAGSQGLILKTTNAGMGISGPHGSSITAVVYPNPANDALSIRIGRSFPGQEARIELCDATGRSILRTRVKVDQGSIQWKLPRTLVAGTYIVRLFNEDLSMGSVSFTVAR